MPTDRAVIRTVELTKRYGDNEALRNVSLQVEPGEIFGLLGQNGAGKSTLIKILLGIVGKTDGDAELLGEPVGVPRVRNRVGFLPEDHAFPVYHTAGSLLHFYGQLYGMSRDERNRKIPDILETVGIRKRMDHKIRTYSKGMKQRLGIASAIFHDPEVIFLDEPTDGVDPVGRREIRELMERLKSENRTIFINSHLLGEVELVCDRVAILQRGEMIRMGTVEELTREQGKYELRLAPGEEFPAEAIARLGYQSNLVGENWEVLLAQPAAIDTVLNVLSEKGLHVRHLIEKKETLEDVFVKTTDQAAPGTDGRRPNRAKATTKRAK